MFFTRAGRRIKRAAVNRLIQCERAPKQNDAVVLNRSRCENRLRNIRRSRYEALEMERLGENSAAPSETTFVLHPPKAIWRDLEIDDGAYRV